MRGHVGAHTLCTVQGIALGGGGGLCTRTQTALSITTILELEIVSSAPWTVGQEVNHLREGGGGGLQMVGKAELDVPAIDNSSHSSASSVQRVRAFATRLRRCFCLCSLWPSLLMSVTVVDRSLAVLCLSLLRTVEPWIPFQPTLSVPSIWS